MDVKQKIREAEALAKLDDRMRQWCTAQSVLIDCYRNSCLFSYENHCGKLRGYLECLCQCDVIAPKDIRTLYIYFSIEDRKQY